MKLTYGSFIKKHRIASGYKSQRELAIASSISSPTISRIEKEIQKPNPETLRLLVPYLKTTTLFELYTVCGYIGDKEAVALKSSDNIQMKISVELSDKSNDLQLDDQTLRQTKKQRMLSFLRFIRLENTYTDI